MDNLHQLLKLRRDFYKFLSSLFCGDISKEFVEDLAEVKVTYPSDPEILEGFQIMEDYVARYVSPDDALRDIEDEFVRLFSGISNTIPTTKSEFLGEGAYGRISLEVDEKMRQLGYIQVNKTLPPDHIAVELDFMAALIDSVLDGDEELHGSLRRQLEFLEGEIFTWIPQSLKKLEEKGEFYKGVAKITNGFLKLDKRLVNEMMLREG